MKMSRSFLGVALVSGITALAALACAGKKESDELTAQEVCGGLSQTAASAIERVTASKSFGRDSGADLKSFAIRLSSALEKNRETDPRELCRIHPEGESDLPIPRISFEVHSRDEIPPDEEEKVIGEMDFPFSLQAISTYTDADVYFECRSSDIQRSKGDHPVIHGRFSYGPRLVGGKGSLDAITLNMDILQHVARNVAGELGCENHGDIPKRDEPW